MRVSSRFGSLRGVGRAMPVWVALWIAAGSAVAVAVAGQVAVPVPARVPPDDGLRLDGAVHALALYQGDLVAGGSFRSAGGVVAGSLARWSGTRWTAMGEPFDGTVHALVVCDGRLIAGGEFRNVGATQAPHVAAWNGSAWEAMGAGTDGPVYALAVHANLFVYAGGRFTRAGDTDAHAVARWYDGAWSALGAGFDGEVRALVFFNGGLMAGGDYVSRVGGGLDRYLMRYTGGTWRRFAFGVDAPVSALAVHGVSLIAGGAFTRIDLVTPARGVARFTGTTWAPMSFGLEPGTEVRSLLSTGEAVIAGGTFTQVDLRPAAHVVQFDGSDWYELGGGTDAAVEALVAYAGGVVAGGAFARAGDVATGGIAAYAAERWHGLHATPVIFAAAQLVASDGGTIVVACELASGARGHIQHVGLQRAAHAAGPWADVARVTASEEIRIEDRAPAAATPWYRIVGWSPEGVVVAATAAMEWRSHVARTTLRLTGGAPLDIEVALATAGRLRLHVYDVAGRRLRVVADDVRAAGIHRWTWDGGDDAGRPSARGVCFVRLETADLHTSRKWVRMQR